MLLSFICRHTYIKANRLSALQDVRRQLYADEDDRKFFGWVQTQLKSTEKRLEDGRAVLHHLEAQLINVACDDPGATIGAQLALPLLQERLDAKSQEYARQQAAQAEQDIIKMEVGTSTICCDHVPHCQSRAPKHCALPLGSHCLAQLLYVVLSHRLR